MNYDEEILRVRKNVLLARAQHQGEPPEKETPPATKAEIIVRVPSALEATLLLHPTSPRTEPPSKEALLEALEAHGIVYGVNMELIDDISVKPIYYHVFTIARGLPATVGQDGYLNYLISQTADRAPVIGEDGTADYKNIHLFRSVKQDQPLCEVFPPERGEDGMDIFGNVLEGKFGAPAFNPSGQNTAYNEDQTLVYALIGGHVSIQYGKINIVEVLTIPADVNMSTGNIEFPGDVIVGGDVASGFSITCTGSIVVNGSVEGAILSAGTDISVSIGMLGMDRGSITAGGNIKCKFIQNCTVRAASNIYADSILFSRVECQGDVVLSGKKGALIGGVTSVGGKLLAKTIGSSKHVQTEIHLCASEAETTARLHELEAEIKQYNRDIPEVLKNLAAFENTQRKNGYTLEQTKAALLDAKRYQELLTQREIAEIILSELQEKMVEGADGSYMICKGNLYPNTLLTFGTEKLCTEDTYVNSKMTVTADGIEIITP